MDLNSRRFINEKFGLKVLQKAGYQGIRWPSLVVIIFWTHFVGPRMARTLSLKFWLTYLSRKTYTNKYKHPLFGYGHSNEKYWILLLPCEYIDHVGEQKIKTLILQSFQYIFVLVKMFSTMEFQNRLQPAMSSFVQTHTQYLWCHLSLPHLLNQKDLEPR